eukprot:m.218284 g.218284  ORF g.218284 m.218284 type:complete len:143 (+) comp15569_c0_seq12:389-817(+)
MSDGRVFGVGIGVVFLGLLYLFSLFCCAMYHSSIRARFGRPLVAIFQPERIVNVTADSGIGRRVYFLTLFFCSAFTIFLISIPRESDEDEPVTAPEDKTFVLREFMLFFMAVFFAWALLLIPCFHWKERIVAREIKHRHRRT